MSGERPNQPTPETPQPGVSRTMTTGGQPAPGTTGTTTEPQAPKAQSEIGPTTYGGPKGPVAHGPDDAETKAAYALGHPSQGLAAQRQAAQGNTQAQPQAFRPGQTNPEGRTPNPQGTSAPGAPQSGQMQRVRMTRDEGGHTAGQEVTLPADEAKQLTDRGAAEAL